MKKIILLTLIISFLNLNSMELEKTEEKKNEQIETKSNKFELPAEIWALIFDQLINFKQIKDIIESARTIPELKWIIKKIHKSYFPISKKHNEILKQTLNKYYLEKKAKILKEIKSKLEMTFLKKTFNLLEDINAKNDKGCTALMHSSCMDGKEIVKLLIENGADIDAQDQNGYTALMWAVDNCCPNIVQLLIKNDANIFIKNNNGDNALALAKSTLTQTIGMNYERCKEIIELLEKKSLEIMEKKIKDLEKVVELLEKTIKEQQFNDTYIDGNYYRSHDCVIS